jgi:hypothetical protein
MILVHFVGVKPDDRFGGKTQFNMTNPWIGDSEMTWNNFKE